MLKTLSMLLLLMPACAFPAFAAEQFGTVLRVMLGPQNAHIAAEQEVPVVAGRDGRAEARFLLPKGAVDISITAEKRTVEDWSSVKTHLDKHAPEQHERRLALMRHIRSVDGEITAAQARLELWKTGGVKESSFDDLDKRDGKMRQLIPELCVKLHELEEQVAALRTELDNLPVRDNEAVLAVLSLSGPASGTVRLSYSYTIGQCGWRPVYRFTALPDKDVVRAQLFAEIRQYSGQDWNNAEITLVSHNTAGRQSPGKLLPWRAENAGTAVALRAQRAEISMMEEAAHIMHAEPAAPQQEIMMADRNAFISWELGRRALREGTSRLSIREAEWKAPIFRLARPVQGNNVFIAARCVVEDARAWPAGNADYFLDGASAGAGVFALDGNRAVLFFGSDPRVNVERELDSRQSGRSGIIVGKRRDWEWKWTFKAFNGHAKPVLLRVEDAQPQAGDKDIAVTVNSTPEPRPDENHTLYWELTVPARESANITHSVVISAPADMQVRPGR